MGAVGGVRVTLLYMIYMGSQKSSGDHFLGVVFNEETHS